MTPQFNQGSQDIFNFGKKKSNIHNNEKDKQTIMREEFRKLILDQSDSEG